MLCTICTPSCAKRRWVASSLSGQSLKRLVQDHDGGVGRVLRREDGVDGRRDELRQPLLRAKLSASSGMTVSCWALATPTAWARPLARLVSAVGDVVTMIWIWSEKRSAIAGAEPRYGTCSRSRPA